MKHTPINIFCLTLLFLSLFFALDANGQSAHKFLKKGDEAYDKNDFKNAEESYKKAEEKKNSHGKGAFNIGNALFKQKRYDEAAQQYQEAAKSFWKKEDQADALFNLGNTYLEKQDLAKSIEAYKSALRLNPEDLNTKKNLTLALQKQKQQQQQQKNNQNKQNNQTQNQQNKPQNQSEQPNQENQQNQNQAKGNSNPQPEQQEKKNIPQDRQAQEQLLKVIEEADKKTYRKVQQTGKAPSSKSGKDW